MTYRHIALFCMLSPISVFMVEKAASAETFEVVPYILCQEDEIDNASCGRPHDEITEDWRMNVGQMNLIFRQAKISFRAVDPVFIEDDDLLNKSEVDIGNILDGTYGEPNKHQISYYLVARASNKIGQCSNGIPCPGTDEGFDGDERVWCYLPDTGMGTTYAHEMGHFWCLRHTFSFEDAPTNNPPNHDIDESACLLTASPPATPPDPGLFEGWNNDKCKSSVEIEACKKERDGDSSGNFHIDHEWCSTNYSTLPLAANSPEIFDVPWHRDHCDIECVKAVSKTTTLSTTHLPLVENMMSYYQGCGGPYITDNDPTVRQPFTSGQVAQIQECRYKIIMRKHLKDVCEDRGGDLDNDGQCDWDEHKDCVAVFNPVLIDSDTDGIPDNCDLCPNTNSTNNIDSDLDGVGDACDPDIDGDGCCNDISVKDATCDGVDQHPNDKYITVGIYVTNCPGDNTFKVSEAIDSDGDGILNCADEDDDEDGLKDNEDPCIISADGMDCIRAGPSCPLQSLFDLCKLGGGCLELLLKIASVINPDPNTTSYLEFGIAENALYLSDVANRSRRETVKALLGQLPAGAGPLRERLLSMDIVRRSDKSLVTNVMTYDPAEIEIGGFDRGRLLRLELPQRLSGFQQRLKVDGVWRFGDTGVTRVPDRDRDGIPDFADNCLDVANGDQWDTDGDRYGNACDADFFQEFGVVGRREVDAVRACAGVDLSKHLRGLVGGGALAPSLTEGPREESKRRKCESFDIDGNGVIDLRDEAWVRGLVGQRVGPSGLVAERIR